MSSRKEYLNTWELNELFYAVYHDDCKHRCRNIAIFEVAKYCALRVSEITNMRIDDYDPFKKIILCNRLKGSNTNLLRIVDPNVYKALDNYLMDRSRFKSSLPNMFLSQKGTPISRQRLDRLMKYYCSKTHIQPEKWHFHVLKHSRAVELAEYGLDVDDIKFWLGHRNIQNTFVYLQYTTALKRTLFLQLQKIEGKEGKRWNRKLSTSSELLMKATL